MNRNPFLDKWQKSTNFRSCLHVTLLSFCSSSTTEDLIISQYPPKVVKKINYVLLAETFYVLATTSLKIALGLFFLRILTKPWQRKTFYVILSISSVYGCLYIFVVIFQCKDPRDLSIHVITDTCLPDTFLLTAGYLYSSINTITDWTFVLVPLLMLSTPNMDRKTKFSVGIIMALGAVGSVGSILRIVYVKGIIFGPDFFDNTALLHRIQIGM
ncbi:uncharacterized protein BDZ99DRAFT_127109 [Mytilinidion resinicola]|uniref:Rhodopsin domain-containing protein n=1 Tax=Mytilinidion resinicola TaxID=574789 RepID=A0A6A6Z6Z4_9PEZI|nr:uncharacterized protein BDZ99DRAFT_127109 [Mytilinidion resinicola]KAF2816015.1 hypothetical protein BDZ99DRAFT_127109 [Mytilinidion resinicola]